MWSCYHVNPHWHIGFEHELTQNAQRLLEVCTQEIKKVHITTAFYKEHVPDIFGSQREEELTMIEQQINPALDNNAHVSNNVHDDVTTCVCI